MRGWQQLGFLYSTAQTLLEFKGTLKRNFSQFLQNASRNEKNTKRFSLYGASIIEDCATFLRPAYSLAGGE
jgi:hypothetical protein